MRKEAKINEWKSLYDIATEVKKLNPWNYFWDMDVIYLEDEDAYISILGRGGETFGISVYEGEQGYETFKMLAQSGTLGISPEFAMYLQNNLTCYWGNRDELSEKQRSVIKELGYKYRGKNQWLYFMSFKEGYMPYNQDADEVKRMTGYLSSLLCAVKEYLIWNQGTEFGRGDMLCYNRADNKLTMGKYNPEFGISTVDLAGNEELMSTLKGVPKALGTVEIEIFPLYSAIKDKECDRPINPVLCLIADSKSGMVLAGELSEPREPALVCLANAFINTVFQYGLPKKIRIGNIIIETMLKDVCRKLKIKLEPSPFLPAVNEAIESFRRFRI